MTCKVHVKLVYYVYTWFKSTYALHSPRCCPVRFGENTDHSQKTYLS
jgi:hypothetical protein